MPAFSALIRMVPDPVATRSISKVSEGMVWPCACMIIGTRRTMPSRSGLMVNRPRPAAACSSTGTLRNRPGKSNMKRCGSSPSIAIPVTGSVLSSGAISSGSPDSPSTTREALMASARIWSLLGSARSLARVSSSRLRKVSAAKAGLRRSGSENTASNAITTAPSRVNSVTRSAIRVRGHGHCPSFSRLFSSISTMVTGLAVFLRGSMRWKASKVLTRISSTGAGIGDAQRGESDQEREAQQPGIADAPIEPSWQCPQSLHKHLIVPTDRCSAVTLAGWHAIDEEGEVASSGCRPDAATR